MEKELVVGQEVETKEEVVNDDVVLEQKEVAEQSEDVAKADSKPEPEKVDEREHNFKELRDKIKKTEKERDDLLAYFSQVTKQEKKPELPPEPDYSDDDLLEGRHLKKEIGSLRKQMDEYKKQSYEQTVEVQLQAKYPDFNEVMTYDNICALRKADPDLADSLASNPNLRSKAMATYKQIKKLGIVSDDGSLLQKQRIQNNSNKPRSSATIAKQSDSPLAKIGEFSTRLTPELKAALYKDMVEKARGN